MRYIPRKKKSRTWTAGPHRLLCETGHCSNGTLVNRLRGDGTPQWVCQRASDMQCHACESRKPPQPQNLATFENEIESLIGLQGCDVASTQAGCEGVGDGGSGVTYGSNSCCSCAQRWNIGTRQHRKQRICSITHILHTTRGHVAIR